MTDKEILLKMKETLVPQGSLEVVRVFLKNSTYMEKSFIDGAIKEFEKKVFFHSVLDSEISNLEKLGMMVLLDSSYITDELNKV